MADFTKYEYQEKLKEMTELLKNKDGWGDGYSSSMGQQLIQMIVDVTDSLHYMLERRNAEAFLETASLRSSIMSRASELGYRFRRSISNNGYLTISVVDGLGNPKFPTSNIYIPRFTEINFDGKSYWVSRSTVIPPDSTEITVHVNQGSYMKEYFDINDENFFTVENYETIDNENILISSDSDVYFDVNDHPNTNKRALSFLSPDEKYYDIMYATDGMRVVFGDNLHGNTPTNPVEIEAIKVDPSNMPIETVGIREFTFAVPPMDSNGNEYQYVVENSTPINGYRESEDSNSIKRNAIDYHKTNNRAVNTDDYAYWVKNSGVANIVDARAMGEEEIGTLVFNLNNVYITYLKADGTDLTFEEEVALRQYMENYKTSQAHLVLINSRQIKTKLLLDVRKNTKNPSSDSEVYDVLYQYLLSRFSGTSALIGGSVYGSDIVNDIYDLETRRNGISYPIVEFAKIDLSAVVPFSYPQATSRAFVSLTDSNFVDNSEWVLIISNIACPIPVSSTDSTVTVYDRMRDKIMENTPIRARVIAGDIAVDDLGNPLPIEISNGVGEATLIGENTPRRSPTELVSSGFVGSAVVRVVQSASTLSVSHYYYGSPEGRRPMIPMLVDTVVNFTAPSDTAVDVYVRDSIDDQETETFVQTIQPNEAFTYANVNKHGIQFEYATESNEDVIAVITYPEYVSTYGYGIEITTFDRLGKFTVKSSSGDYSNRTVTEFTYRLPTYESVRKGNPADPDESIDRGTFKITNPDGFVIFTDDGNGGFLTPSGGTVTSGNVNYQSGEIQVPATITDGDYNFEYKQNDFNVISVGDDSGIQLIEPKPSLMSEEYSQSVLRVL